VAQVFHFYAGAVDKHYGETIPVAGGVAATFREPLGVVGLIVYDEFLDSSVRVSTPFGGFKQSGFGRELGMHALAGYSEVKSVYISTD